MNIAIVTREIAPLTKSGGIGTAVRGLCDTLISNGKHALTVYYTGRPYWRIHAFADELRKYGMQFRVILSLPGLLLRDQVRRCHKAYTILSKTRHDMYLFHEFMADGLFCLRAHRHKGCFAHSRLGVVTHGSALWVDEGNGCVAENGKRRLMYAMEQECCELADFVVSPSHYLIDWMRDKGWHLPESTHCIPNFIPTTDAIPSGAATQERELELVFFGRMEERKGARVFCEALNRLPTSLLTGLRVTFLGKEGGLRSKDIRSMLHCSLNAGLRLTFLTDYGPQEALAYLRSGHRLAVMPSLQENSPCVVAECLESEIPFLASSVGGGKELVLLEDRPKVFFAPESEVFTEQLQRVLQNGPLIVRPAHSREKTFRQWQDLLTAQVANIEATAERTA